MFEKLKPKKVTIYNNYNDYQELVSLLKICHTNRHIFLLSL